MKKKRSADKEKQALAHNLKSIWLEKKKGLGLTQEKAASVLGWTQGNVTQYLNGIIPLNTDAINKFSQLLKVDPLDIDPNASAHIPRQDSRTEAPQQPNADPYLPIITFEDAANGTIPDNAEQYGIAPFDAPMFGPNAFIVRMDDDSMESNSSDSIKTGSLLFIDSPAPSTIKPGKTVVAMLDGDSKAVIRKYRDRGFDANGQPMFELAPLNDDYNKTTVNASNPGKIIGLLKMRQILS